MLTEDQIQSNKERYLDLINSISLPGSNVEGFVAWLSRSDFFKAPASSHYHCAYEGGLCQHSLNVYDSLCRLLETFKDVLPTEYPEDSVKIVALLHDISKTNFYEMYLKNVKNEETDKWEKIKDYRVREANSRFLYGNHEQNSEYIARTFFPLSVEESSAILHHHGGMSWDSAKDDITGIYDRYSLATLLHLADMMATYVYEKN